VHMLPFYLIVLIVNSCNVHVLFKIIFSNNFDLFYKSSFLTVFFTF